METDCDVCRAIWLALAGTEQKEEIDLGTFGDALSSSCPIHTSLIQHFKDEILDGGEDKYDVYNSARVSIQSLSEGMSAAVWVAGLGDFNVLLMNKPSVPNHPGKGRILDRDWMDIELIPLWKHICLETHSTICENPLKIWETRPAWLIDIQNWCIVSGLETTEAYVALSYRYGDHPSVTIDAGMWSDLQNPNALRTSPYLSPMVRDAIYLTSVLEERYLWADAFCIPHHDRGVATDQLLLMGAIYGNAIVTIIAADTDSKEGIPGIRGISNSRNLEQTLIPFGKEQIARRGSDSLPSYFSRGWTYQEREYSRRKLIFRDRELHWRCSCSAWHEAMTFVKFDDYGNHFMHTIQCGFPDMWCLSLVISLYNSSDFRYEEDAFPAISGLLSVASRSFTNGFLYGLPEMLFDCALAWRPNELIRPNPLRRRTPSQRPIDEQLHPSQLPSWSWVGWQGHIEIGRFESAQYNESIQETIPITKWYTADSPTSEERRLIESTWFTNRQSYKNPDTPLPPGWTRHELSEQDKERLVVHPDGCGEVIFKHEAWPEAEWLYPFPVSDISDSTPPVVLEQTAYLFCETQQACLRGCRTKGYKGYCVYVELRDDKNGIVGDLDYHNDEQLEGFPVIMGYSKWEDSEDSEWEDIEWEDDEEDGEHYGGVPLGKKIDLVAISQYKFYELDKLGEPGEPGAYPERAMQTSEHIAVLWVEWKDGVAYRLASGKVEKEAWYKLPRKDISLILG